MVGTLAPKFPIPKAFKTTKTAMIMAAIVKTFLMPGSIGTYAFINQVAMPKTIKNTNNEIIDMVYSPFGFSLVITFGLASFLKHQIQCSPQNSCNPKKHGRVKVKVFISYRSFQCPWLSSLSRGQGGIREWSFFVPKTANIIVSLGITFRTFPCGWMLLAREPANAPTSAIPFATNTIPHAVVIFFAHFGISPCPLDGSGERRARIALTASEIPQL